MVHADLALFRAFYEILVERNLNVIIDVKQGNPFSISCSLLALIGRSMKAFPPFEICIL